MNRASSSGRKFGRQRDPRRALIRSLANALILNESIETTSPKARTVVSYTEKLITKAKKADLHSRRQIIAALSSIEATHKLVDELVPKLNKRTSGYFKIEKLPARRGDNALISRVSFVDDLSAKVTKKTEAPAKDDKTDRKSESKVSKS
jgi:large subunit ribosomal protein L17